MRFPPGGLERLAAVPDVILTLRGSVSLLSTFSDPDVATREDPFLDPEADLSFGEGIKSFATAIGLCTSTRGRYNHPLWTLE